MNLALFFTYRISLKDWIEQGVLEREKLLYERLLDNKAVSAVYWFTYGAGDGMLANELHKNGKISNKIIVVPMPRLLNGWPGCLIYTIAMPFIHKIVLNGCDILKTNQVRGSIAAFVAKVVFKKKLLARCGYLPSQLRKAQKRWFWAITLGYSETVLFRHCDIAMVTSGEQRNFLINKQHIDPLKIAVVPNYVNTQQFYNRAAEKEENGILYVGRISPEKNLYSLCDALHGTDMVLHVYGRDMMSGTLAKFVARHNNEVELKGVVDSAKLPFIYSSFMYYAIVSYHEGMPKSLLEAMACGCVCIGTNVPGIKEIIKDGINGYLACGTGKDAIREAIMRARESDNTELVKEAAAFVRDNFSLEMVVDKERMVIQKLAGISK
ncbi:MAG: glycosyltransferase [Chitinivibrionales bacterium]|nr:glycosyltransferase [Chitinivibrionales bacterium]